MEFFGLARTRAGVSSVELEAESLRAATVQVERLYPDVSQMCFENGELRAGWVININGRSFVRDLDQLLEPNDCALLMSADVGG
jgi:hypothetical protein